MSSIKLKGIDKLCSAAAEAELYFIVLSLKHIFSNKSGQVIENKLEYDKKISINILSSHSQSVPTPSIASMKELFNWIIISVSHMMKKRFYETVVNCKECLIKYITSKVLVSLDTSLSELVSVWQKLKCLPSVNC